MSALDVLLRLGLVTTLVRGDHESTSLVVVVIALVSQGDQPGIAQNREDVPDAGRGGVVDAAGQVAGYLQDRVVRGGDHPQVHRVHPVFAEAGGTVCGDPVYRNERAVDHHVGDALAFRLAQSFSQLRGPLGQQLDGFVDLAPAGRGRDRESGADVGEWLAFGQVSARQRIQPRMKGSLAGVLGGPGSSVRPRTSCRAPNSGYLDPGVVQRVES